MGPLNPDIQAANFNLQADGCESNYRLANFRCSNTIGWACRVEDPMGFALLSAEVEHVLEKVMERKYPVGVTNLNFAFAKIGVPAASLDSVKELPDLRTWVEKIADQLVALKGFLPNLKIESLLRGKNFVVIRCNSKKQAKKVMKTQLVRNTGKYTDRRGDSIMLREVPTCKV